MPEQTHPLVYEINTRCWLANLSENSPQPVTLASVPDAELAHWQQMGFTHIWLMGVWKIGPRSRAHSLQHVLSQAAQLGCPEADIHGSTYSIAAYEVEGKLGGEDGLRRFRERLHARGLKLLLDFIPNHVGLDHPWLQEKPNLLVHTSKKAPGTFRQQTTSGTLYLAHGKDPYFPPWSDTAQLDYRNPETRAHMRQQLLSVAARCDGVRCDMAMLVLNDVFEKNWSTFPVPHPPANTEFWGEAISEVRTRYPAFLFLAEAYWDLEPRLQQLGFDYVYLKTFYDHLVARRHGELLAFLQRSVPYLQAGAFFLENHDEPRIAGLLPWPEHRPAALLLLGLPGLRLLHEGQLEGWRHKVSVHLGRRPTEDASPEIANFYEAVLTLLPKTSLGTGAWELLLPPATPSGESEPTGLFVMQWSSSSECWDWVIVNLSATPIQARIPLPSLGKTEKPLIYQSILAFPAGSNPHPSVDAHHLLLSLHPFHAEVLQIRRG